MTTVKIDTKDKDAVAKICALHGLKYYFLEDAEGGLQSVTIDSDSARLMWYLGRSVQLQVEINDKVK